ncbi:hypothetical protein HY628_00065 [Candidatus Uhrbacteria bacterium]|nr:hypothetical protein [Candidatus Uhrbacteria bacterium]
MLSERQAQFLEAVIREYTKTAEPVGSGRLTEMVGHRVSPATARNELAVLEQDGYLTHPHTSAGRVPTEKGYRFFITHFLRRDEGWAPDQAFLAELQRARRHFSLSLKTIAQRLAEETGEVALIGFGSRTISSGLANLFAQPEFQDYGSAMRFFKMLDQVDEVMHNLEARLQDEYAVYLGSENPFGQHCGMVLVRIRQRPAGEGILGLVGPVRMDYEHHLAVLETIRDVIEETA